MFEEKIRVFCGRTVAVRNPLNSFFVNVGPNLAKNIESVTDKTIHTFLPKANENSIFISPVTEQELINIV